MKEYIIIPRHKDDIEAIENLSNCSFEEIKGNVPELLEWLQDGNWPVSGPVSKCLSPYVNVMSEHLVAILRTNDGMWKYWVLMLIRDSYNKSDVAIMQEVMRLAQYPTKDDIESDVQEAALDILNKKW